MKLVSEFPVWKRPQRETCQSCDVHVPPSVRHRTDDKLAASRDLQKVNSAQKTHLKQQISANQIQRLHQIYWKS